MALRGSLSLKRYAAVTSSTWPSWWSCVRWASGVSTRLPVLYLVAPVSESTKGPSSHAQKSSAESMPSNVFVVV